MIRAKVKAAAEVEQLPTIGVDRLKPAPTMKVLRFITRSLSQGDMSAKALP